MILFPIPLGRQFYIVMEWIPQGIVIASMVCCLIVYCYCEPSNVRNFMKNRSRSYFHSQNGPLDRELREDENLYNSDGQIVNEAVYIPLGIYVTVTPIYAIMWAWRTLFLFESSTCDSNNFDCFYVNNITIGEQISDCDEVDQTDKIVCLKFGLNLEKGLVDVGGIMFVYQLLLSALPTLLKKMYCCKYSILIARCFITFSYFICTTFGVINVVNLFFGFIPSTILTQFSETFIYSSFGLSISPLLWIRWEHLYTKKYIKGDKRDGSELELLRGTSNSTTHEESTGDSDSPERQQTSIDCEEIFAHSPHQVEIEMEPVLQEDQSGHEDESSAQVVENLTKITCL